MGLLPGDTVNFDALAHGMLLASGNDAAVAMAEHICGTETAFVEQMNRRAQELGMETAELWRITGANPRRFFGMEKD